MKSNPSPGKQVELENEIVKKINFNPSTTQSIVNQNHNSAEVNNYGINQTNQPYVYNGPLNYSNFSIDYKLFSFLK